MELSQLEFATRLGVAEQTYRTWDSGRRTPPRSIVSKAKRLKETAGGALAERVGAANKAVVYQWESRRRRPSPVLWQRVQTLGSAP
jgi:DNA-binding transcriptional regulator YiaG